jgi:hypothetical protein
MTGNQTGVLNSEVSLVNFSFQFQGNSSPIRRHTELGVPRVRCGRYPGERHPNAVGVIRKFGGQWSYLLASGVSCGGEYSHQFVRWLPEPPRRDQWAMMRVQKRELLGRVGA